MKVCEIIFVFFIKNFYRRAEPKDLLSQRYQQFQRRMARHYLNMSSAESSESSGSSGIPSEPSRQPLTKLSTSQASIGAGNRIALSNTERDSVMAHNGAQQISRSGSGLGMTTGGATSISSSRGTTANSRGFEVFSDASSISADGTRSRVQGDDAALSENSNWKSIPTQTKTRKENQGRRCNAVL